MSRIGKIARLPKAVREELNHRLEDGEQQSRLVEWLNGREEVQAVLKAEFDGRAINEPNLTAWAQGGYEDWRREQESLEAADRMVEETAELDALTRNRRLADRAADMAALALGQELIAIRRMEDGAEKRKAVLKLVRGLVRLRNSDRACERGQREAAEAERTAELHEHWAERAQRRASAYAGPTADRLRAEATDSGQETDVRAQMIEIVGRMSDAQIAETLQRNGYTPSTSTSAEAGVAPAKRVWWTDEDEALEGTEFPDEREGADEESGEETRPPEAARTLNAGRVTSNAEAPGSSNLPPEGETQPVQGTIPQVGAQPANTGQPVASLGRDELSLIKVNWGGKTCGRLKQETRRPGPQTDL